MSYTLTLTDDSTTYTWTVLEIPIADDYVEGTGDNTTLDGNVYTDYLFLKKNYKLSWSIMTAVDYAALKGFYERQFTLAKYPLMTMSEAGLNNIPVRLSLSDGGIVDNCLRRQNVKISMRESSQL
jgi:hypothetical protein